MSSLSELANAIAGNIVGYPTMAPEVTIRIAPTKLRDIIEAGLYAATYRQPLGRSLNLLTRLERAASGWPLNSTDKPYGVELQEALDEARGLLAGLAPTPEPPQPGATETADLVCELVDRDADGQWELFRTTKDRLGERLRGYAPRQFAARLERALTTGRQLVTVVFVKAGSGP